MADMALIAGQPNGIPAVMLMRSVGLNPV